MVVNFALRHRMISGFNNADVKGMRWIAYNLPRILIPRPTGPVTIKTLHGFDMNIDPVKDQGVERSIYYTGTYEKGTLFMIGQLLKEGDTFVDVGANIGLMSIYASGRVKDSGKVIGFEPNPGTRELLQANMKLNGISNIEISAFALGNEVRKSKIYDRWESNRGSASLVPPGFDGDSHDVDVIPLSSYLKPDHPIQLMKVDIEGYELEALKGAGEILSREFPPMLIIECSENIDNLPGQGISDLYDFFQSNGKYRLFKSTGGKVRISKLVEIHGCSELPAEDNIYCFTNLHLKEIPKNLFVKNQKL